MRSPDGRYWLIYNGELYNYLELRRELDGWEFRTKSDAEVLLAAYVKWGPAALERFVGMFALAIFDADENRLFIARDRFGVKPLYYAVTRAGAAFGSEIKQLRGFPGQSGRANAERLRDFVEYGLIDHRDETCFADVLPVPAGARATIDLGGGAPSWLPLRFSVWWRPPEPEEGPLSEAEAAATFRRLFEESVRLHMRADVRVGSCLSGGLDSTSILCAMSALRGEGAEPLEAVSAVFPGADIDESAFIDLASRHARAASRRETFEPSAIFDDLDAVLAVQDEPYGSTSIHAQHRVFRRASDCGVKVMLDGQGADELLGGYHGAFHHHYLKLMRSFDIGGLATTLEERRRWHGLSWGRQLAPFAKSALARLAPGPRGGAAYPDPVGAACAARGVPRPRSIGTYCVALTAALSLPSLLRFEDRNSMAFGVEARVPFLDHRLAEFALRLGDRHKIVGDDTKRVLRAAMAGLIPEEIRLRRDKIGFATPEAEWFRGPLKKRAAEMVDASIATYPDLFPEKDVRSVARDMLDGSRPYDHILWRIIVVGAWGRKFGAAL
jgi:asparagine synthase (glutamine-hydrolysing)